ncbi:putative ABC transport system ATP-binding protein [Haloactinopolyspora alba]|uniref:Putative ABC transport system ATP-binding protein n=1 Tax=Haloactinopolyspora alba TaxID=648780 RepID=A0A2P8E3Z4_9ACTN|nr:ABC transporter ATP-binding protein [Haloactinopolyspora alba]PSL04189.1 putative ABC transport system ATP-binding protein [Haloactinopolyspora alba]
MSSSTTTGTARLGETGHDTALGTLRRGLALSPEITQGLALTLAIAAVATAGRVVVPIAIQQTIDGGLNAPGGADLGYVRWMVGLAAVGVVVTVVAAFFMNVRVFRASESGLATLRTKAFRHVHDLSVLTQDTERRGSLVSRVTSDVDTISQFVQFGGLIMLVSVGQLVVATVIMAIYSWQLTILVWVCFLPLFVALRYFQRLLSAAFLLVRERVGSMLGAVSEAVVGAQAVRAYAVEGRTQQRVDDAVEAHRMAATRAQRLAASAFSTGEVVAGIANAAVVVAGVLLGVAGDITLGRLLAFIFLVTLFIAPVQVATEVLAEAQNAIAGWRRVLGILDTRADVADPGDEGVRLPRGPVDVRFEHVSYAYPDGPTVLHDVDVAIPRHTRVAVVGETGSGKTTFAKLLTRLMDPASGRVLIDGVDLRDVRFDSLRERVVMVPQEGFLFDDTLAANLRYGRPEATEDDLWRALTELGVADWADGLPSRLATQVGQRGESLSAGERQLVALARAYLADPDLLVLDEATSAVDPATEVRLARALEGISRGRTSVTIAHRLSTAEAADEVFVFDAGRLAERGRHSELVAAGGLYAGLHEAWVAQSR